MKMSADLIGPFYKDSVSVIAMNHYWINYPVISFVIFRFIHYLLYVFCYRRLVQDSWNSFWPSFITKFFKIASVQFSSEIFIRRGCTRSKHVVNPEYIIPQWYCLQTIPQFTKRQAGQKKKKASGIRQHIRSNCSFAAILCNVCWSDCQVFSLF